MWRISVEGMRGGPGPIEFALEASPANSNAHLAATRTLLIPPAQ
jgi:hypothetical protein